MTQVPESKTAGKEIYGLRDTPFQRRMARRSAEKQAAFLLPYLRPGMRLLDCGCGPGSITIGLAKVVAPGGVVGVDIDPGEIERARQLATEQGIANVRFETGSVYELPFADASFDAAFSNALLDHLSDPVTALREMRRVLKGDGVLGVRTADRDGYLMAPTDPLLDKFGERGEKRKNTQGVSVRIGKNIRAMLREAGFAHTEGSASYDCYGSAEEVRSLAESAVDGLQAELRRSSSAADGGPDRSETEAVIAAWRAWGDSPDAFFAMSFCEGVGWCSNDERGNQ
ncbi:MAG: methyltransferase domain-containing protein [Caldilineaceae bacterium]|nr:methyltransferase domain-containing protein [Caldilineaceae bacterium]